MREKMYGQYVHFSDYQALEKQNQDLREALEFYANRSNYSLNGECGLDINSSGPKGYIRDFGNMARSALGQQTDAYLNPPQAASEQDKD